MALARFDLRSWLESKGFEPQGFREIEYVTTCPFCLAEQKFSVNVETRKFRCFVCRKPSSMFEIITLFEGNAQKATQVVLFNQVARSIEQLGDGPVGHSPRFRAPDWEPQPIAPPDGFIRLQAHVRYTHRRNLDLGNLLALGAGYCSWGRYQDRLIFPVRRPDGAWLYFQGRAMWEREEDPFPKRYMKNRNPASSDPAYASASDVMLGYELFAGRCKSVVLVEGPTDLVQQPLDLGAGALFGKVVSERHVALLQRAGVEEVIVAVDRDAWDHPKVKDREGKWVVQYDKPPPAVTMCSRLAMCFRVRVVMYPRVDVVENGVATTRDFDSGNYSVADNRQWRASAQDWSPNRLRQLG